MKQHFRKILTLVLATLFVVSVAMYLRQQMNNVSGSQSYETALHLVTNTPSGEAVCETEPPPSSVTEPQQVQYQWIPAPLEADDPHMKTMADIDLNSLQKINPQVIGWIFIPDTTVNYPLMQGEDNSFYLSHTWEKEYNTVGSIFVEHLNTPDLTDFNTIIYGHNLHSGAMFASIRDYEDLQYYQQHPYIYIRTASDVYRYEIYSSYLSPLDGDAYRLSFREQKTKDLFLSETIQDSVIDTGIIPETTDRFLTLSTCSGSGYANRWVVHARLKMIQVAI